MAKSSQEQAYAALRKARKALDKAQRRVADASYHLAEAAEDPDDMVVVADELDMHARLLLAIHGRIHDLAVLTAGPEDDE